MTITRRFTIGLVLLIVCAARAVFGLGEIISSFPLDPRLDDSDGLAWDGVYLWSCAAMGQYFYRVTTTGSVVYSFVATPGPYGYLLGATYDGQYLWRSNYDPTADLAVITQYTTTGSEISGFLVYDFITGDVGMTYEPPNYLWIDGRKYFTSGGNPIGSFPHPGVFLADMAFVGHYLWANGSGPGVYQWDTTGSIHASFPTPGGGFPSGKTFDGNYLWVVNATNRWCYQVNIDVVNLEPASFGRVKAVFR